MKRVVVIGNTGSGKSTFAAALADRLGVPYTDSDDLFWQPGWTEVDNDTFRARLNEASSATDGWVIAGNYFGRATDVTWPRADTLVWLDLPLPLIVSRSVRRTFKRAITRDEVCNGNREKLRFLVPKKLGGPETPLWQYAIQHHRYVTPIIEDLLKEPKAAHLDVHRLTSRREVAAF